MDFLSIDKDLHNLKGFDFWNTLQAFQACKGLTLKELYFYGFKPFPRLGFFSNLTKKETFERFQATQAITANRQPISKSSGFVCLSLVLLSYYKGKAEKRITYLCKTII